MFGSKTGLKIFAVIFIMGLYILIPDYASARIVNIQDIMASVDDEGFYGNVDFSLDWNTGSYDYLQFEGGISLFYNLDPHLIILSTSGTYAEKNSDLYINKYYGHLRYRIKIHDWFQMEAFVQSEYKELKRLKLRAPFGIGPRLEKSFLDGIFYFAVGTSYMFEYMSFSVGSFDDGTPYSDSGDYEQNHRWNNYLTIKIKLIDSISLMNTVYIQPKFDDFKDYMVLDEVSLDISANEWLSITFSFDIFYDSRPPDNIVKMDTALNTTIGIEFGPFWGPEPDKESADINDLQAIDTEDTNADNEDESEQQ